MGIETGKEPERGFNNHGHARHLEPSIKAINSDTPTHSAARARPSPFTSKSTDYVLHDLLPNTQEELMEIKSAVKSLSLHPH